MNLESLVVDPQIFGFREFFIYYYLLSNLKSFNIIKKCLDDHQTLKLKGPIFTKDS